ncbi:MAG TPA: hypothetical protein VK636_06690 [Gemmatimonadaceae bacterium]|nr:hypothetical protein [Gemmatimonadaceae bacterium]
MPSFGVLDLVIGLAFIYLLLSFVCLAINEGIATVTNMRAQTLQEGIRSLLHGPTRRWASTGLASEIYAHPLVAALRERRVFPLGDPKLPSYIPSRTFTLALIDTIRKRLPPGAVNAAGRVADVPMLRQAVIDANLSEALTKQLTTLIDESKGDLEVAKKAIDQWFDDGMGRLSAVYKQRIHLIGIAIAFVVTFALDANTVRMAKELSNNTVLRSTIAAQAIQFAQHPPATFNRALNDSIAPRADSVYRATATMLDSVRLAGLPLGFQNAPPKGSSIGQSAGFYASVLWGDLPGLLLTAFAVSLGAPFWFDILNKVVNIRGAGRAPEEKPKSPEELPAARA